MDNLEGSHGVHIPIVNRFNPYSMNGGTVAAISGDDFAVVASDTRLSEGFLIHSREVPKCYQLTDKTVLVSTGFHGDVLTLTKTIDVRLKMYEHEHNSVMDTCAIASMLSKILYYRRFFPYYVYNVIGGIDEQGRGCVFSFDPVGSYQREFYRAGGSAGAILQPLLDNQLGWKHQRNSAAPPLTMDRAKTLIHDVFISAAERDIYTGDHLHMKVITSAGIQSEQLPLRND